MKDCKQLSKEIFEGIEKRTEREKRAKKQVKRGVLACLAVLIVPLSFAFATGRASIAPLFEPIERVWEHFEDDSSTAPNEERPNEESGVFLHTI